MNQAVIEMLNRYQIRSPAEGEHALKEIIQEIALLGLHRANFFEKAAFYGGTALRILYSLPRFSEDLDFSLFTPDPDFSLKPYFSAVERELAAYGFQVSIEGVNKRVKTEVESAFIKAQTNIHFLKIQSLRSFGPKMQTNAKLQIKFEVDTDPAQSFQIETRYLLAPTSFPVISLKKPDLFAGKIHALLFRQWRNRVKGRDFYDFVWYLKESVPVRLDYFREKAIQSGHAKKGDFQTLAQLKAAITKRFSTIDFASAKSDVSPFIKDQAELEVWSKDFFVQITERLKAE
jgi:predicted nucleotidyltransferase component of viral defense system